MQNETFEDVLKQYPGLLEPDFQKQEELLEQIHLQIDGLLQEEKQEVLTDHAFVLGKQEKANLEKRGRSLCASLKAQTPTKKSLRLASENDLKKSRAAWCLLSDQSSAFIHECIQAGEYALAIKTGKLLFKLQERTDFAFEKDKTSPLFQKEKTSWSLSLTLLDVALAVWNAFLGVERKQALYELYDQAEKSGISFNLVDLYLYMPPHQKKEFALFLCGWTDFLLDQRDFIRHVLLRQAIDLIRDSRLQFYVSPALLSQYPQLIISLLSKEEYEAKFSLMAALNVLKQGTVRALSRKEVALAAVKKIYESNLYQEELSFCASLAFRASPDLDTFALMYMYGDKNQALHLAKERIELTEKLAAPQQSKTDEEMELLSSTALMEFFIWPLEEIHVCTPYIFKRKVGLSCDTLLYLLYLYKDAPKTDYQNVLLDEIIRLSGYKPYLYAPDLEKEKEENTRDAFLEFFYTWLFSTPKMHLSFEQKKELLDLMLLRMKKYLEQIIKNKQARNYRLAAILLVCISELMEDYGIKQEGVGIVEYYCHAYAKVCEFCRQVEAVQKAKNIS